MTLSATAYSLFVVLWGLALLWGLAKGKRFEAFLSGVMLVVSLLGVVIF